jgi:hypothetical protein
VPPYDRRGRLDGRSLETLPRFRGLHFKVLGTETFLSGAPYLSLASRRDSRLP